MARRYVEIVDRLEQRGREPWNISTQQEARETSGSESNSIQLYWMGAALQGNSRHTAPGGRYVIRFSILKPVLFKTRVSLF